MSKDDENDYKVGYGKPPKKNRFKLGQSGNPKGRPKKDDKLMRLSSDNMRKIIMNDALRPIEVVENGKKRSIPKLCVIISQLNNQAAKGDLRAAKLSLQWLKIASEGNDKHLHKWTLAWFDMQERKLKAEREPGSLQHFNVMYQYFMYKKDMRVGEGIDKWPYEDDEPITKEDWHVFMDCHDSLKRNPGKTVAWPPKYPSSDPDNYSLD